MSMQYFHRQNRNNKTVDTTKHFIILQLRCMFRPWKIIVRLTLEHIKRFEIANTRNETRTIFTKLLNLNEIIKNIY